MIEIRARDIRLVDISLIKLNPENRNTHSPQQIDELCKIIRYQGFRNPLTVSNRTGVCVAGEGRYLAAKKLRMTHVPVSFQDFDNAEQEYAAGVSDNAIALWADLDMAGINRDIGSLGPDFDVSLLGIKGFEIEVADKGDDLYTNKIEIPIYTPKQSEQPSLKDCINTDRCDKLLSDIEALNLPEKDKTLLKLAAMRHIVFNYENIAEYYAHANAEVQKLMESSCLVIIDYAKAIELGFVTMTKNLAEAYEPE